MTLKILNLVKDNSQDSKTNLNRSGEAYANAPKKGNPLYRGVLSKNTTYYEDSNHLCLYSCRYHYCIQHFRTHKQRAKNWCIDRSNRSDWRSLLFSRIITNLLGLPMPFFPFIGFWTISVGLGLVVCLFSPQKNK
jgi:hypothetical protein